MESKKYRSLSEIKYDSKIKIKGYKLMMWFIFMMMGGVQSFFNSFLGGVGRIFNPILSVIECKYLLEISDKNVNPKYPFDNKILESQFKKIIPITATGIVYSLISLILILPGVVYSLSSVARLIFSDKMFIIQMQKSYPESLEILNKFNELLGMYPFLSSLTFGVIAIVISIISVIIALMLSQTYYILADKDNAGVIESLKLSAVMMKGNKMDLFILGLMFIPNALACIFIIPMFWVIPHMTLAYTEFYKEVRDKYYDTI